MDCRLTGSSVHGISQARILMWVAISFCRRSSQPRGQTRIFCIVGGYFTTELPGKPLNKSLFPCLVAQSCLTLCNPMDCSLPGYSVHRILQARILAAAAKSLQLCLTLCDPIDGSPPGSPVPGILQARTLEWVVISFSNARKWKVKVKSQSCLTLSDPMD